MGTVTITVVAVSSISEAYLHASMGVVLPLSDEFVSLTNSMVDSLTATQGI